MHLVIAAAGTALIVSQKALKWFASYEDSRVTFRERQFSDPSEG